MSRGCSLRLKDSCQQLIQITLWGITRLSLSKKTLQRLSKQSDWLSMTCKSTIKNWQHPSPQGQHLSTMSKVNQTTEPKARQGSASVNWLVGTYLLTVRSPQLKVWGCRRTSRRLKITTLFLRSRIRDVIRERCLRLRTVSTLTKRVTRVFNMHFKARLEMSVPHCLTQQSFQLTYPRQPQVWSSHSQRSLMMRQAPEATSSGDAWI